MTKFPTQTTGKWFFIKWYNSFIIWINFL